MIKWIGRRSEAVLPEVLPPLRGWGLKVHGAVWGSLMFAALAMTGIGAWQGSKPAQYSWLNYGFGAEPGGRILNVTGEEAIAKGIARGDTILAIDAVPLAKVGNSIGAIRGALARPEGESVALTLRDKRGQIVTHRLRRSSANTEVAERIRRVDWTTTLLVQCVLLVGAVLLFRRRREPVPAILAVSFAILAAQASRHAWLWLDQPFLGAELFFIFGWALMLGGLLLFPDGRFASPASRLIGMAILGWGLVGFVLPMQITFSASALIFLLVGAHLMLRYRRMEPGIQRQQVRWAIFGFVLGISFRIISIVTNSAAGKLGGKGIEPLMMIYAAAWLLAFLCIVGGLLVSLMRYRLYDADAVIGRSAAYGVLTLSFVALFAGSQKVIEALGETYFGGQIGGLAGAAGAAVAAVLVAPLHRRVNDWAERRFQKGLLRLRLGLPRLVGDLREIAPPDRIAGAVAEAAMVGVQATRAAVLVGNSMVAVRGVSPEIAMGWLSERDIETEDWTEARLDRLFPMRLALDADGTGRIGWLLLGPRPDGSFYGKDEREALTEIREPVARALAIAGAREEEKREMRAAFDRLDTRLRALEDGGIPRSGGAPAVA